MTNSHLNRNSSVLNHNHHKRAILKVYRCVSHLPISWGLAFPSVGRYPCPIKIGACGAPQALISPIHGLHPIGSHCVPMGRNPRMALFFTFGEIVWKFDGLFAGMLLSQRWESNQRIAGGRRNRTGGQPPGPPCRLTPGPHLRGALSWGGSAHPARVVQLFDSASAPLPLAGQSWEGCPAGRGKRAWCKQL